jgi:hypothetical protein
MKTTAPVRAAFAALVAVAAVSARVPLAAEQQSPPPSADSTVIQALLRAPAGSYLVTGNKLSKAPEDSGSPVFVQADAYRRSANGVQVPVVVGVESKEPWVLKLEILSTASAAPGQANRPTEVTLTGQPGRAREIRELTLQPGIYAVAVALARRGGGESWVGSVAREEWTIPSLAAGVLEASPVVLGESVTTVRETGAKPFVFGTTNLTPTAVNRFRAADKIHVALRVSGWKADADAKPDVTVEYVFQQQFKDRYRFFNKTKPQELNAKTLKPTFDGRDGMLDTGMTIPLAAFPPGEFQLVVRVRDKRTQATTTQKTTFVIQS